MQIIKTWLPAFSGMVCLGLGAGLISIYGFFVEPLSQEFGVGVAVLNIGPVALLLVPGLVAPFVGRLADRLPIKRVILVGASLSMLSLLAISQAPSLLLVGMGFLCFALGLTLYGPVVVNGLMVKLYPGQEARALAVAAIGISLATATLPLAVGQLLADMDWRMALASLALGLLVILWLVVMTSVPSGLVGGAVEGQHRTDGSIYRKPAFWMVGLCVALAMNVSIVLAICYPPHFASQGYSVAEAGWFLSLAGIAGMTGKICMAWMGDAGRHYAKWLAAGLLLLQVAGLLLLLSAEDAAGVMRALCLLGFGGGAFLPMHPYLNSRYFDAAIIGQVNGAQMPLFLPFSLVGAPLAGYIYDRTGSYDLVWTGLAVVMVVAALLVLRLPASEK